MRRALDLGWRLLLVACGGAVLLVTALPDPARPVLVAAALAELAVAAAAVSGVRLLGTGALVLVTVAVLLAAALDESDLRPVQTVAAGALVLGMLSTLDRVERQPSGTYRRSRDIVLRAPPGRRLAAPVSALGAASLVAVTAAQHAVPSVALVVVGLAASVAALVIATRSHRS